MTFGSVCDGIGCGHLAFNRAGFDCAWSFEIEAFPSAVLAYRFHDAKNHGDMLKCAGMVESGEIEAPDVFIGGTPCQAFSVAGKRKGLEDARGNLSITFCGIADAIDDVRERDGKQPCVVLWENVPGVLSDKGNAFGCFLGELSGSGCELQPAGGRWGNAGCVFGPRRTAAWRVLDSQYFGVAQRRRRLFVVASAGDGCRPEEVLFEREGVRRDSPPSREKGEGFAADVGGGVAAGHWDGGDCHPSLTQSHNTGGIGASNQELFGQRGSGLVPDICGGDLGGGSETITVSTYDMRGRGDGSLVNTLCTDHASRPSDFCPVVAFAQNTREEVRVCNVKGWNADGSAYTLDTMATQGVSIAFEPRFVRTTGGQPSVELNPCLRADANTGDGAPCVVFGFNGDQSEKARSMGERENQSPTLRTHSPEHVATTTQVRRLTPRECERLQALPDDWGRIPWRGKYDCPDGLRYKGIGNGQTVTVMEWLARRIKENYGKREK